MRGIRFQLKSIFQDKFCLMTFFLPILVAAALHFMGSIDMSALGELHFAVIEEELSPQTITWLKRYGAVDICESLEELEELVREPSTNVIGVKRGAGDEPGIQTVIVEDEPEKIEGKERESGIRTVIAGDEMEIFQQAAATLPALYEQRKEAREMEVLIRSRPDVLKRFQDLFIPAVLMTAMFMGCTFNAMNIISEKEGGVALVHEILPLTTGGYILQKITAGFVCGCLSSLITACICFRPSWESAGVLVILIVLASFVSAVMGLFIGRYSSGLMTGVVFIKIVLLLFLAVPLLCALLGVEGLPAVLCNMVPSQPAFAGLLEIAAGNSGPAWRDAGLLAVHGAVWFSLYSLLMLRGRRKL